MTSINPHTPVIDLLPRLGPGAGAPGVSREESLWYVRGLARSHYENFSVLTSLVPAGLRDDFASVYAFCRWADDLGDETGSGGAARERSLELLGWWREQLGTCFDLEREPTHPVMVALRGTVDRHGLARKPFDDLIDAFVQDQRVTRYRTWDQLVGYCGLSANPVGRIVLHLGGYPENEQNAERYAMSDATCTALQLINFWQDVRRDLDERDRVYIPEQDTGISAEMLRDWAGRGDDPRARVPYIKAVRGLVQRTGGLFERGAALPGALDPSVRPVVWLFGAGGRATVRAVESIGCATLWERPRLSKATKARLVAQAWVMSRLAGSRKGGAG